MLSCFTSTLAFFFELLLVYTSALISLFSDFSWALACSFVYAFCLSDFCCFLAFSALVSYVPDCPNVPFAFCSLYFFLKSLISSESESVYSSWPLTFFLFSLYYSSTRASCASCASDLACFFSLFCLRLYCSFLFSCDSTTSLSESIMWSLAEII